jgi:lipopolysaccharide/colanic/teichoic acid biosynthesis glycosyltransferase
MALAIATPEKVISEITPSTYFLQTINRERKRSERSGRPFLLALINAEGFQADNRSNVVLPVAAAVGTCIRETDTVGWYDQDTTLGVLLTEIGAVHEAKVELLTEKICSAIRQALPADEFYRLRISVRVLPNCSKDGGRDDSWEEVIYRKIHHGPSSKSRLQMLKRTVDVLGSSLLLLLSFPLLAVLALLVKLTSEGPVLFRQQRVGRYGRLFTFYKFRTMRADNDPAIHREFVKKMIESGGPDASNDRVYKIVADPRVTSVGRVLRKLSLDELPQFFNIIRGDMSLVGPRPPVPYEFDSYRPWHKRRLLEIKPGLTGLWQVQGRSRTTFDEMVRMDLRYARSQSLWLDLKIMAQTPAAMLLGRGAY